MRCLSVLACCMLAACELQEVTLAESEDVVVAEITLRAGERQQTALLHRTLNDGASLPVEAARVEITNARGDTLTFAQAEANRRALCLHDPADTGTCYISTDPGYEILAGETYTLRIQTADGRVLTGATRVPQALNILRPARIECSLPPNTAFTIEWTSSEGTWVYVAETLIAGLKPFLESQNIELKEDPLRLFGLSLSNVDTTVVFPTEFGLFQRFDPDLTAALIAIRNGLPASVTAEVTVAAADRNYVNWERGGNFNPSGLVRVPSIRGDGTGTFGSIVPKRFIVHVGGPLFPAC